MTPEIARATLSRFGAADDEPPDLAIAALLFAVLDLPGGDCTPARAHLAALSVEAAALRNTAPAERAGALAALLADRHGYAGDTETYDDLANANLIRVIERRRGLPVALGVLWIHAARAAGWPAWGIDFPAHFLVGIEGEGRPVAIDPFARGHVPSAAELHARLGRLADEDAAIHPRLFRRMRDREVLLRLQNNIRIRRLRAGDLAGALACLEDMLRLVPRAAPLWCEAGLVHRQLGHPRAAMACLERCLSLDPSGEVATQARAMLTEIRSTLN
ncbi:SirB1 family protein [Elioraea sp.]|uniref:SirB1 family protein n=1 Tax=Elioraea sp. TaxID=2185103 RepID=UPI003F713001